MKVFCHSTVSVVGGLKNPAKPKTFAVGDNFTREAEL